MLEHLSIHVDLLYDFFFSFPFQVAVYGGLADRVHDLLLCGVDPSLVDLSVCLDHLRGNDKSDSHACQETEALLRVASRSWTPSHHAYLYGPHFKAYIASLCLVKVSSMHVQCWSV